MKEGQSVGIGAVLSGERKWTVAQGDCRELLRAMPAESCHLICTSPPYW